MANRSNFRGLNFRYDTPGGNRDYTDYEPGWYDELEDRRDLNDRDYAHRENIPDYSRRYTHFWDTETNDWRPLPRQGMQPSRTISMPGPYAGRGPRNYRRSDERILQDVCERLTQHGRIDASDVDIDVRDGEVVLKGNVPDRQMKYLIEDVAESVPGVAEVHDQIRVRRGNAQRDELRPGQVFTSEGDLNEERTRGEPVGPMTVHTHMRVVDSSDLNVGRVMQVREHDFLVDRPDDREVYIPYSACQAVLGDRVRLDLGRGEINRQHWPEPEQESAQAA